MPVISDTGELIGIIALDDIAGLLSRELSMLARLTSRETNNRADSTASKNGVHYACNDNIIGNIIGNVIDKTGTTTGAHSGGGLLIGRQQYTRSKWKLDSNGCCQHC